MMSGRVERVREGYPPPCDVGSYGFRELDAIEQVGSCPTNTGFGYCATCFERLGVVVEMVDDEI
jgi:hypothetical protein